MPPHLKFLFFATVFAIGIQAEPETAFRLLPAADDMLNTYCYSCHDEDVQKGDVQLDNLGELKLADRLDLLNRVQEQIYIGEMPPKKKSQPTDADRRALMTWLTDELRRHDAAKLDEKLRRYEFGNYVDHDALFSGEHAHLPGATEDRRWLVSEFIFADRVNRVLDYKPFLAVDGNRQYARGFGIKHDKISNPFLLPNNSGVRYYANESLNGGHLLTMLANSKAIAEHFFEQSRRNRNYLSAISAIMALEREHEDTLKRRDEFLRNHAHRVLKDLYGDRHAALLPEFVSLGVDPESTKPKEGIKKAPFHSAHPGKEFTPMLYAMLVDLQVEGESDLEFIARCERRWFNYGLNPRQIRTFVTFFHGYLDDFRKQAKEHKYEERIGPRMAYKPLADDEMAIVHATILKHRQKGDTYTAIIDKCMATWEQGFLAERDAAGLPSEEQLQQLVVELYEKIHEREPTPAESTKHVGLAQEYVASLGKRKGIKKLSQTILLNTEFVYRHEFGTGDQDAHGRRLMAPRDASYALAYALTDSSPDAELAKAAANGRLNSREDYRRELERMLAERDQYYVVQHIPVGRRAITSFTNLPVRKLRFFREFFGYPQMLNIFKDRKRFGGDYDGVKGRLVVEADLLVENILKEDKNVIENLLTTEDFYVFHTGDNEAMQAASDRVRRIYDHFKDTDWENFEIADLDPHLDFIEEVEMRGRNKGVPERTLRSLKLIMPSFGIRFANGQTAAAPYSSFSAHGPGNAATRLGRAMDGPEVAKFFNIDMENWNYQPVQPAERPNRKGMLTHPAWLIAFAQNTETDPIHRGKFVLEKLLAGTVPDVPITVDAIVPEDHTKTMRDRLVNATERDACWKCHERMNPLGYAFEIYDDFGRFRVEESIEHPDNLLKKGPDKADVHVDLRDVYKTLPVNAKGYLKGTGNPKLDGEVDDAIDLIGRLAKSDRVRQSVIRNAFRFFLGRNETLADSKTLIDADNAYLESGGSFDAVIISLLTSDSFIYRMPLTADQTQASATRH